MAQMLLDMYITGAISSALHRLLNTTRIRNSRVRSDSISRDLHRDFWERLALIVSFATSRKTISGLYVNVLRFTMTVVSYIRNLVPVPAGFPRAGHRMKRFFVAAAGGFAFLETHRSFGTSVIVEESKAYRV